MARRWITYGVSGVVGIGLLAGGATAAAASMDLRMTDGQVVPGGAITGKNGSVLDRPTVQLQVTETSATVVSATTPAALTSTITITSAASAPAAPAAPAPASPPVPASAPTPASVVSTASAGSVASAGSN